MEADQDHARGHAFHFAGLGDDFRDMGHGLAQHLANLLPAVDPQLTLLIRQLPAPSGKVVEALVV